MEKDKLSLPTAIYIRVSTEDQAKEGFSVHAQREKLTKYAEVNDWDIVDYYVDDGVSGKNLIDRKEVTRMLEDVKLGKVKNVLIYKLDRLTRSMKDLIYLIEYFEINGCTFNSQTEKIDTSNAVGRMFVKIIGIFAEFERENLAERVSLGYEQKTREGNYTNTNGVYGYDYLIGEGILKVNETEALIVKKIFSLYIEGNSYYKIANIFNNLNVPTKRGGNWAASTIQSIINNPLYIGKVRYGISKKNNHKFFEVTGKNITPIITEKVWNEAQNMVNTRKKHTTRRYQNPKSYYFHTLKCGICGSNMSAKQQFQHGKLYISYNCNLHTKGLCKAKGFSHRKMEQAFQDYLTTLPTMASCKETILQDEYCININQKETKLKTKINKLQLKKNQILNNFINEIITVNDYQTLVNNINYQIDFLNQKLNQIKNRDLSSISYNYDDIKSLVVDIKLNWINLTYNEKLQFLEKFVDEIKVYKDFNTNQVIIDQVKFIKFN